MAALLTSDDAEALLGDHFSSFASFIERAVERYHDERATAGPVSARSRACLINDFASENAEAGLADAADVQLFRTDDETLVMIFAERAIVRIKKLTRKLRISAIPTDQAKRWADQEPIENFPNATNLVIGYTLDELGQLDQVLLVCHKGSRLMWKIDLDETPSTLSMLPPASAGSPSGEHQDRAKVSSDRPNEAQEADDSV